MRETCTSGSVRGEGGNILAYSALKRSENPGQPQSVAPPSRISGSASNPGYTHYGRSAYAGAVVFCPLSQQEARKFGR
jgi:hypothetical protein